MSFYDLFTAFSTYFCPLLLPVILGKLEELRTTIAGVTQDRKSSNDATAEGESAEQESALQPEDGTPTQDDKNNDEPQNAGPISTAPAPVPATTPLLPSPTASSPPGLSSSATAHRLTIVLAEKITTGLTAALVPTVQQSLKTQVEVDISSLVERLDAMESSMIHSQNAYLANLTDRLTDTLALVIPEKIWADDLVARLGRRVGEEVFRMAEEKRTAAVAATAAAAAAAAAAASASAAKQASKPPAEPEKPSTGKPDPITRTMTETNELIIARLDDDLARVLPEKLTWTDDLVERLGRGVGEVVVRVVAASNLASSSSSSSSVVTRVVKQEEKPGRATAMDERLPGKPELRSVPKKAQNQELFLARLTDNLARILPDKLADRLFLAMSARGLVRPAGDADLSSSSASSSSSSSGESDGEDEPRAPGDRSREPLQRKWVIGQQFPGYGGVEAIRGPVEARIRALAREEDLFGSDVGVRNGGGAVVEGPSSVKGSSSAPGVDGERGREGGGRGSGQGDGEGGMAGRAATGTRRGGGRGRGKGKGRWKGKGKARA